MIGAIVRDNIVENTIVLDEAQLSELSAALGCEIVDARPYGLCVGDLRTEKGWTRNAGGEQMVLPLLEPELYDSYTVAAQQAAEAEARAEEAEALLSSASEIAAEEALAILTGEVEA